MNIYVSNIHFVMSAIRPPAGEEGYTLEEAKEYLTYWQRHLEQFLNQLWYPEMSDIAKKRWQERTDATKNHIKQFELLIHELQKLPQGAERVWSTGAAINPYLVKV